MLRRLAATLPDRPPRAVDPAQDLDWSTGALTMTVEALARAVGKSSWTVYRMASSRQLFVCREGAGRGTVLIDRDQVDPANRPPLPGSASYFDLKNPGRS